MGEKSPIPPFPTPLVYGIIIIPCGRPVRRRVRRRKEISGGKRRRIRMRKIFSVMLAAALLLAALAIPARAEEVDVVIIGAGGAGLSAALEAAAQGAEHVVVLEMT